MNYCQVCRQRYPEPTAEHSLTCNIPTDRGIEPGKPKRAHLFSELFEAALDQPAPTRRLRDAVAAIKRQRRTFVVVLSSAIVESPSKHHQHDRSGMFRGHRVYSLACGHTVRKPASNPIASHLMCGECRK